MLAVEFVSFDVGKHTMRQPNHLVIGGALIIAVQQLAIIVDELLALGHELLDGSLDELASFQIGDVAGQRGKGHREVVVPGTMVVVEAVADIDVEPGVARDGQFFEPLPA